LDEVSLRKKTHNNNVNCGLQTRTNAIHVTFLSSSMLALLRYDIIGKDHRFHDIIHATIKTAAAFFFNLIEFGRVFFSQILMKRLAKLM
jgi:uncharacterized membrane protein